MNIGEVRNIINKNKIRREEKQKQLNKKRDQLESLEKELLIAEKAGAIIKKVALLTQQEFEFKISEIITLVLEIVFDNPYKFR